MANLQRIALLGLFSVGVLFGARGCGGVSNTMTREGARDQATKETCDRYAACGLIGGDAGASAAYPDRSACEIDWRANWDSAWPAADCEGKIDQGMFGVCVNRIRSTSCTNILDFLSTLAMCGKQNVCTAAADAGSAG